MNSINMLKITMQGTWCWLDLNLIPSDHELGVLPCADICFCRICILPFVVRILIPPRPTVVDNISSDSQLFIFPFLIISRAASQSVAPESEVLGSIPGLATYFYFSFR